ncbi:hypothetical protein B0T14DRAFT_339180 [Immersiella caudata]|uniref:Uncharacterized protein n=1 Tax=Immersiella caudata TaxID=314043 RepID=A0AA39THX3_9PEZI|nr:hypothetical protein B0T14DRAFT_339180 [Immersiella caudata]
MALVSRTLGAFTSPPLCPFFLSTFFFFLFFTMINIITLITALVSSASAVCFYPDGSVAHDTPCTDSTAQSTCCGIGFACLGHSSTFFSVRLAKTGFVSQVRLDTFEEAARIKHGGVPTARISGLGVENCSTGFKLFGFLAKPSVLTTIGIASSSPTSSTAAATSPPSSPSAKSLSEISTSLSTAAGNTATAATSPNTPPAPTPNNGMTTSVAVGVSVGGLGLTAGAVATWLLFRKRRKSSPVPSTTAAIQYQGQNGEAPVAYDPYKQATLGPVEVPSNEQAARDAARYELPCSFDPSPYRSHSQAKTTR